MAGFEDIEAGSIEKKPVLKDSSSVVNGVYIPPTLERYETNKSIAKPDPVKCQGSGKCTLPAVIRPTFHETGPKNLCGRHWDKCKNNVGSYAPGPMWIQPDPELHKEIRVEDARERQRSRARDAAAVLEATGIHQVVQGPGRPVKPASEDDPVTTVIDRAASGGGHIGEDHEKKLYAAHQALLSSIDAGNGTPDPVTYHNFAKSSLPDATERNEYFIHAMNYHKKLMGRNVVPAADPRSSASEDFNRNYSAPSDIKTFDAISELMQSSTPSRRDAGLTGERND